MANESGSHRDDGIDPGLPLIQTISKRVSGSSFPGGLRDS